MVKPATTLPVCIIFEDEHLLVVNKPAGWNTHAPAPYAGEGIYDWLRHREPRWANLAIIHRLDKETSGVMVFGKTPSANRSLTEQFASRAVHKKYLLLTDHTPRQQTFTASSKITRAGERYVSGAHGEPAETSFRLLDSAGRTPDFAWLEAEPLTGRTHQIRVHAAEHGFPILGDTVYGGSAWSRVCLHAADLSFKHPETGATMQFSVPEDFTGDARLSLRAAILERGSARLPTETVDRSESEPGDLTNAFRLIHGASDGWPGWYVDRLGDYLLSQSERELNPEQMAHLQRIGPVVGTPIRGAYHKRLSRYVRGSTIKESSPQRVRGEVALERFVVCENGVKFELSFAEGYSVGLFLDQRDNRRRLLTGHIAAGFALPAAPSRLRVLNTFAYTCGFSVCAALAGGETTSLDLSKKYLDWGRRNFTLNGLDPTAHNVIYGDTFDWLKRFAKKGRVFDVVILDPPTFSQSKAGGAFRAEKDYGRLLTAALGVLCPGGVLLCSTNAADWPAEEFVATVQQAARGARRGITQHHYAPQPPDFPARRAEPAYLKTMWLRFA